MKIIFTPYIYILFLTLIFSPIYGQDYQLKITTQKKINSNVLKELIFQKKHLDKKSVYLEVEKIIHKLELKGYLNVQLDTVIKKDSLFTAQYTIGSITKKLRISYLNLPTQVISAKTLKRISSHVTPNYIEIQFKDIQYVMQYFANLLENYGLSFTEISLSNIQLQNEIAYANLMVNSTKPRTIDKIVIKGYEQFPKSFISHQLNLKLGSTFNKSKLEYASASINKILFVEEQKSPEVLFTKDSTFIYLYLKKKQANRFDGVVGFSSKEESNGLEFNGYLDLTFNNIFNNGETIALFWKNNGNDSQRFYIATEIPYLFKLPIIPKLNFELYRRDSTFSNTSTNIDLLYPLNTKGFISASFQSENSNNLIQDIDPSITSFKNSFYGATYNFEKIIYDNLFPVQFRMDLRAYFGSRKTDQNKTNQAKFELHANYLWSIDRKNYIFLQNRSALLKSENYFENELFRIGGTNDIRGVNEESIFASAYSIFNLEYRYRPTNLSYLYTITDFSFIENKIIEEFSNIFSLGIGYAFNTKLGLLNISYAVGKFNDNPFQFNNSKLHIKMISFF